MSEQALWTIQFSETVEQYDNLSVSEQIQRGGTFVLIEGQVFGGGLSYYFVGTYKLEENKISMVLNATRYNDLVEAPFGTGDEARFILNGIIDGEEMTLHGHLEDAHDKQLHLIAKQQYQIDTS